MKSKRVIISIKASEHYFPVVMFRQLMITCKLSVFLHKVVQMFGVCGFVIIKLCCHLNERCFKHRRIDHILVFP